MSGYESRAALVTDPVFVGRLNACVTTEAAGKAGAFPDRLLSAWGYGGQVFAPLVVSAPGFDQPQEMITDGDILAAVQASWDRAENITMNPPTS